MRLWARSTTQLTSGAAIIAAASLFSRVLGLFRDRILAGQFGAGDTLDVYYAAFRIPDALYNIVIMGALSAGFIPVFIAVRKRMRGESNQEHWKVANSFLTAIIITLGLSSLILSFFTNNFSVLIAPGFSPDKQAMVNALSRIMLLSPVLLGISAVIGGVLQSFRNFFVYSLAPIFYNIGIIIGALFFVPTMGYVGLGWGVVLGALLHLFIQLPAIVPLGWRLSASFNIWSQDMRAIWKMTMPRTLALGAQQINLVILTAIASFLSTGSLAVFNLATNIAFVPVAIFGVSYALAAFPVLSDAAADNDIAGFRRTLAEATSRILFFIIPIAALFLILRAQIVRAVLGSSIVFDWADTVLTSRTLFWLAVGLVAEAMLPLLLRGFYAKRKTLVPLIIVIIGNVFTIICGLWLTKYYDIPGLALASALGSYLQLVLMWLLLRLATDGLEENRIVASLIRIIAATAVMVFVAQGIKTGLGVFLGTTTLFSVALQGGASAIIAFLTYISVLRLMHSEELAEIVDIMRDRLFAFAVDKEGLREDV